VDWASPSLELDTPNGADIVGLFQRVDEFVRIGRACSRDRIGEVIDLVIRSVPAIGREVAVFGPERVDERHSLRRYGDIWSGEGLIKHALDRAIGVVPEA
jgi:hypothetical protein